MPPYTNLKSDLCLPRPNALQNSYFKHKMRKFSSLREISGNTKTLVYARSSVIFFSTLFGAPESHQRPYSLFARAALILVVNAVGESYCQLQVLCGWTYQSFEKKLWCHLFRLSYGTVHTFEKALSVS